jgi:hypothetical protein
MKHRETSDVDQHGFVAFGQHGLFAYWLRFAPIKVDRTRSAGGERNVPLYTDDPPPIVQDFIDQAAVERCGA